MQEHKSINALIPSQTKTSRLGKYVTLQLFAGLACGLAIAQEVENRPSSQNKSTTTTTGAVAESNASDENSSGSYDAARQSLSWMTRSLQQMADKLDSISSKLDPNASEEEINREVKRAMREAFADFLPSSAIPGFQPSINKQNALKSSATVAEIDSNSGIVETPIWDPKTPSWVKDWIVDKEVVRVAIESSVESSAQECRVAMDQQMVELIQKVLDEHVLVHTKASEISELTPEYLTTKLLKEKTEYELVLDRPSGTYYQLWRLVHIGPDQIKQIKRWERESVTTKRVAWLSGSAVSALLLLASASGLTGLLAKRSNRLQGSPSR